MKGAKDIKEPFNRFANKYTSSYIKKGKIQMKKHENLWRKVVALLLCLALASTIAACGGTEPEEDLYNSDNSSGNATSPGTDDDDSVVVIPSGNDQGTDGNGGNSGVGGNSEEQQAFLNSVPKELAGSKVEILVWYKALDSQVAKMQRFEDATGIDIEFVYADEANYLNKLASMKASGNAPEIACIRPSDYPLSILQDAITICSDFGAQKNKV